MSRKQRDEIRKQVVEFAAARFKQLFDEDYSERWGERVRLHIKQMAEQDAEARAAARVIRKSPKVARAFVEKHGLQDPFRQAMAPVAYSLASAVESGDEAMRRFYLVGDPAVQLKSFQATRSAVVAFFESVPAKPRRYGSFGDLGAIDAGRTIHQLLTDTELTAIHVCLFPATIDVRKDDVHLPIDEARSAVWDRERRKITAARSRHGYFSADDVKHDRESAADRVERLILPEFWHSPHKRDPSGTN